MSTTDLPLKLAGTSFVIGMLVIFSDVSNTALDNTCVTPTVTLIPETHTELAHRIDAERKHQLQQDTFHSSNAIIFLGDSITAGLATDAIAPYTVNYGIGGQTTTDLLKAIPDYRSVHQAKLVVLSIGTVDIVSGKSNGLQNRLTDLSNSIPGAMIWNALPPSRKASVTAANAIIKDICTHRANCTFLQTPISEADLMPDGVHLLPSGYAKWIKALQDTITSIGDSNAKN